MTDEPERLLSGYAGRLSLVVSLGGLVACLASSVAITRSSRSRAAAERRATGS